MVQLEYSRADLMDFLAVNEEDFQMYYHDPKDIIHMEAGLDDDEWRLN